jgi:hypothetical protein
MSEQLPPLPDDVRALLDAAMPPAPSADFEARVFAKVSAAAGGVLPGAAAGPVAGGAVAVTKATLAVGGALLVAAGVAGGVVLGRTVWAPEPVVVAPPPAQLAPEVPPPPPPVEPPPPTPALTPAPPVRAPVRPAVAPPPRPVEVVEPAAPAGARDTGLSRERALLEVARTALARGEIASALEAVERHARDFPQGRLAEEREVLAVQALALAGRGDEASARARAFRAAFPDSLLQPAVDAALPPP